MLYRTLSNVAHSFRCYAAQWASAAPFAVVPDQGSDNTPVIDIPGNTVAATVVAAIAVGGGPRGVALNPAGTRAYVVPDRKPSLPQ